jgi:hypothetical protein
MKRVSHYETVERKGTRQNLRFTPGVLNRRLGFLGMERFVACYMCTDVSEESAASTITVE